MGSRHYLDEYLEKVKSLPFDITRQLQLLHDEDKQAYELIEKIERNARNCRQTCLKKGVQKEIADQLKASWKEIEQDEAQLRSICDLKVNTAETIYNSVDKHVRILDETLKTFEEELRKEGRLADVTLAEAQARRERSERQQAASARKRRRTGTSGSGTSASLSAGAGDVLDDKRVVVFSDDMPVDPNEPRYCYCNQVSYGEMVACDNNDCPYEWFHFQCVGISETPKGKWLCPDCRSKVRHGYRI